MSRYVLDTSVAIAWYLPEAFAEAARVWQDRMLRDRVQLIVPNLHYWEFANVLRTHVRAKTLDAPLEIAEPPLQDVLPVALDSGATAYDAVYVALATHLDVPLLTAERASTPWVTHLGKRVQSILR